jgi:DNA mismatch repair protein MutS
MTDIDFASLSPMMQHYLHTKEEYPDCILFYRLGDFYEMFFDDAELVSHELELTLTGKQCGLKERAPMCGVPYHAVDTYLTRLVANGHKVAICEQIEDPKLAKGMVKRAVIRIVTPGTNLDMESLDEGKNNYIFCICYEPGSAASGIAVSDVSTGEFMTTQIGGAQKIYDEIVRYSPSEIICNDAFMMSGVDIADLRTRMGIVINTLDAHYFDEGAARKLLLRHFRVSSLISLGLDDFKAGQTASGALLQYLYDTQKNSLGNITHISPYSAGRYMLLDSATRRNLELTETLREKSKRGSLLWVLDKTKTAMGARLLHRFLE